jgi:hypothetical protein
MSTGPPPSGPGGPTERLRLSPLWKRSLGSAFQPSYEHRGCSYACGGNELTTSASRRGRRRVAGARRGRLAADSADVLPNSGRRRFGSRGARSPLSSRPSVYPCETCDRDQSLEPRSCSCLMYQARAAARTPAGHEVRSSGSLGRGLLHRPCKASVVSALRRTSVGRPKRAPAKAAMDARIPPTAEAARFPLEDPSLRRLRSSCISAPTLSRPHGGVCAGSAEERWARSRVGPAECCARLTRSAPGTSNARSLRSRLRRAGRLALELATLGELGVDHRRPPTLIPLSAVAAHEVPAEVACEQPPPCLAGRPRRPACVAADERQRDARRHPGTHSRSS